ncbi:MAG: Hsp70 family protein [Chthoniobacteraceae bacterium]
MPRANGSRLPSFISPPAGSRWSASAASRMRVLDPAATVYSIKRFMGRRVGEEADDVSYPLAGQRGEPVRVKVQGVELSPEQISAFILAKLKAAAEQALERQITRAVITVPAYFNDAQRNATKLAGELAGLTVERIVNEPTAAALAYGLDRLGEKSKVAVYDLGGGTFDISILELNQGVFQVLATNGNTRLGGDDIDAALIQHLASKLEQKTTEDTESTEDSNSAHLSALRGYHPGRLARLREVAIEAKHRLSTETELVIELPFFEGGNSQSIPLTRAELEQLARPIVERTRQHCLRSLMDAQLAPGDLNAVILVGGQTRMPLVRDLVREIFQREPDVSQNPDEAVALGATIQAGVLSGAVQNVVLLDVTPLSLGIETFGGLMNVIIPRNSTIPIKAGELFTNAMAGQRSMLIRVMQGEREMARDNWELGKFELDFEPLPKGQARVGVQFEIDANGILHVLARDTKTGLQKIVPMQSAVDVSDEAVEKMLEDSLEHAFEDMSERVFTEARLKAEEMLPAVQSALAQVGDLLSADEREEIERQNAEVKAALESGETQRLKRANAALDEATQHLAALLVERAMGGA